MTLHSYLDDFSARDWRQADDGTVRLAMVGLGWWTRDKAIPAVADSDLCEVTTVVSSSTEKAERVRDRSESITEALTYDEFHEGASADAYDAVYIATPNSTHLDYVETAADLGKDVLCEKPMEATVDRAARMVDACADAETTLMIAYRMQTEPAIRRMREVIAEGGIGDPIVVHGHMSQRLLEMIPNEDQWRLDPDLAGTGTSVTDLGIYPLNTTRFALDADPVAVQSSTWSGSDGFEDVPDERAAFQVSFPDGVTGCFSASQRGTQAGWLRVVGTEGEISLDPAFFTEGNATLRLARGDDVVEVVPDRVDQMTEEFDYFADCLLTGREPHPDGEHGLVDMRTIQTVYDVADEGVPIGDE